MGRAPCCSKVGLNRGRWTAEEDGLLIKYIETHGEGCWRALPQNAGLLRCGKSCRLRWINYLRADVKRGNITAEEEELIIKLHSLLGNRWSLIAGRMPGRTDNEIKNYWNTHLSRKLARGGVDPVTHEPITEVAARSMSKPSTTCTRVEGKRRQKKNQTQGGIISQTKEETAKRGASKKLRLKKKPKDRSIKGGLHLASSNESRSALQRRNVGELEGLDQLLNSSAISVNSSFVTPSSCESPCSKLDSSLPVAMKSCNPASFDETEFLLGNSSRNRTAAAPETHTDDAMIAQGDQYPCTATAFSASSTFTDSVWDYSFSSDLLDSEMELFGSELFGCLLPSSTRGSFAAQGDPDDPWPYFLSNVEASYPASLSFNVDRS